MWFQQGDVKIKPATLPANARKVGAGRVTLAHGEATGHTHRIESPHVVEYEHGGERFFKLAKIASVRHEEHKSIRLFPGVYKIGKKREYDHFAEAARDVRD